MIENTGWAVIPQQGVFTSQLHVLAYLSQAHDAVEKHQQGISLESTKAAHSHPRRRRVTFSSLTKVNLMGGGRSSTNGQLVSQKLVCLRSLLRQDQFELGVTVFW